MSECAGKITASDPPVVGRTWEVRPTLFVDAPDDGHAAAAMQEMLRSRGFRAWVGWVGGEHGVKAVSGTIVLDEEDPVRALDMVLSSFAETANECGILIHGLHDAVVQPGWRDERDWGWEHDTGD